jgi:hypothetical protein
MIEKVKALINSQKTARVISEANSVYVTKPFLFGCQLEYKLFGNYIFIKNSTENKSSLSKRKFTNFKDSLKGQVNWNLKDEIFDSIADDVQYNREFNIVITLIPENSWDMLLKTIRIAEKTTKDIVVQRKMLINTFEEIK